VPVVFAGVHTWLGRRRAAHRSAPRYGAPLQET